MATGPGDRRSRSLKVGHTLLACVCGGVLVLAITSPRQTELGGTLSSSLLRFFGRYSYALYVFHYPLLLFLPDHLSLEWVPMPFGSLLLKTLVFILSATTLSVALALVSWHLYEEQFLKLRRFFPYESSHTTLPLLQPGQDIERFNHVPQS